MKIYYSPLSFFAIAVMFFGLWILINMINGGYPTYLGVLLPIVGFALLITDFILRKSSLESRRILVIQLAVIFSVSFTSLLFIF